MATVNLYDNVAQFSASVIPTILVAITQSINAQLKSFMMFEATSPCLWKKKKSSVDDTFLKMRQSNERLLLLCPPQRMKSGCGAAMTYGRRSHLAFNDDGRATAVAARSWEQVFNLMVSATTRKELRMIKPSSLHLKQKEPLGLKARWRGKAPAPLPVHLVRNISWIASTTAVIGAAAIDIYIYTCPISCPVMRAEAKS